MITNARHPTHSSSIAPTAAHPPRHRRPWLPREDRTLRFNAGIVPVDAVAARLGRSRPAVLARARVLGLHWYRARPEQPSLGQTLGDVARLLDVGAGTARR